MRRSKHTVGLAFYGRWVTITFPKNIIRICFLFFLILIRFSFFSFTPNQYSWNQTRNLTVWNIVHNIVNEARRFICMQQNRETWKTKPQYFFHAIWELPSTNWYDAFCISVLEKSVEISWLQVELLTTHGNSLRESPIAGQVTCWASELVFKLTRGVKSVCKNKRSFVIVDLWLLKRGFENRWLDQRVVYATICLLTRALFVLK